MTQGEKLARSPHLAVREDWLALRTEKAIEPDLPIVDPHHHLWDRPRVRYTVEDLAADIGDVANGGHNVVSTVFVECRAMYRAQGDKAMRVVGETEFVVGQAAMADSGYYGKARACAGIVGHIDLTIGSDAGRIADAQIAAGGGRFRGIRHASAHDPAPDIRTTSTLPVAGLLGDKTFRLGFAELAKRNLSFDTWLYHPQIGELADLADAFPDTAIVLDHCGGPLGIHPYSREAIFEPWRASIRELAKRQNVVVKLGGLGMAVNGYDFHLKEAPPSSDALAAAWKPWFETCIEAFGARRCMFESNFPVDKGSCSYTVLWNAFKKVAAGASGDEKAALFHDTAARIYRLAP